MSKTELKKIPTKDDGHDLERFQKMLKTVVKVPKEEVKKYEAKHKKARTRKSED